MTQLIPVFVNETAVQVPSGVSLRAAIAVRDAALAQAVEEGKATVTDARGLALDPDGPAHAGAIVRVVVSARRSREAPDADA